MARIAVIGGGYVGLVACGCFAEWDHRITCIEANRQRVASLRQGQLPIHEPGLQDLWDKHLRSGAITVTDDYGEGLKECDFVFICVGSPPMPDGRADLGQVMAAAKGISHHFQSDGIVVIKSTVPTGTAAKVAEVVNNGRPRQHRIALVSNPEFLREGQAVQDFFHPDRVVIGAEDHAAAEAAAGLYKGLTCPFMFCSNATAEMIKYASNAFLATKISFINEMATLCEHSGVDVTHVARGMGMDHRIGPHFLGAGLGWGGSCLPKDMAALVAMAREMDQETPLLSAVMDVNSLQPLRVVSRLKAHVKPGPDQWVALWGLSFKPDTDDLRESPALRLLQCLVAEGYNVKAYDPMVNQRGLRPVEGVMYCGNAYEASGGSDAVIVATAWSEFPNLDMSRVKSGMKGRLFFDTRNAFDPAYLRKLDFLYLGIGRNGLGPD